jgi:hypothetical protein
MVTLTVQETDDIKLQIADGKLPATALQDHLKNEETRVFGVGAKRDRKGRPIENGIGSKAQPSRNSVEAYRRYCAHEPNYAGHLARMEKDLAEFEEAQRVKRGEQEE